MNVGQSNFSPKGQFQTETQKHMPAEELEKFTGQLVAAQADLSLIKMPSVKTSALDESKELFEEKKTKKQLAEERTEDSLVASYVNEHKVQQSKQQNQWSNQHAQEGTQARSLTTQQAQLRFSKGVDELQGRVADQITEQKVMDKKGHLFNPGLVQAEADATNPKSQFTDLKPHSSPGDSKDPSSPFTQTSTAPTMAEGAAQQKRMMQQQLEQMQSATKAVPNKAEIGSLSKVGGSQLAVQSASAGFETLAKAALTVGKSSNADTPGLNLASVKAGGEKLESARLNEPAKAPEARYTTKLEPQEIGQNIKMMLNAKKTEMTMQLKPEHLGKVEIKLSKDGEVLRGNMKVDSVEAREAMERALPELRENLQAQGFKIDEFVIDVREQAQNSFAQAGQDQNQSAGQGAQNASSTSNEKNFEPNMTVAEPVANAQKRSSNDNLSIYA